MDKSVYTSGSHWCTPFRPSTTAMWATRTQPLARRPATLVRHPLARLGCQILLTPELQPAGDVSGIGFQPKSCPASL